MQRYLLLGTAGHVDHGKTALLGALTGVDTDRLPEEKQRGITIDLGFAALALEGVLLGIVDVPGHERFIKNMLAGATGIDMALLVVAADEGVMPQTREHFEALSYLRIPVGVVALTKSDLVDESWIALVEEEITELVAGSFLQDAARVHVSSKTGDGLEELRSKLAEAAEQVPERHAEGLFRMPIDRCFSAPGQGTVVTGSVACGRIACGDKLQLLPGDVAVHVRSLQSHGQSLTSVERGQRAALNLTGVHFRDVTRGDILATPGSIVPSRLLSVRIEASRFRNRPLKYRTDIRFYTGTAETIGRLRLLQSRSLLPGESQIGQIELQQPVCATWGETFVARGLAANEVIGGGQIIDPRALRVATSDTKKIQRIEDLLEGDDAMRVAAVVALAGARSWDIEDLWQRAGVASGAAVVDRLVESGDLCCFDLKGPVDGKSRVDRKGPLAGKGHFAGKRGARWLHREVVAPLESRLLESLHREHLADPLHAQIPLGRLCRHFVALEPPELLVQLAFRLSTAGRLKLKEMFVALPEWQPQLSTQQTELLAQICPQYEKGGLTPPSVGELATKLGKSMAEIELLLEVAVSRGELVRLPDKDPRDVKAAQRARLYLHGTARRLLLDRLLTEFSEPAEWTVSQFGEEFGLSRKYAIPLCSYLDQTGVTLRQGDLRKLNPANATSS